MTRLVPLIPILVSLLMSAACSRNAKPKDATQADPPAPPAPAAKLQQSAPPPQAQPEVLTIAPDIRAACGISQTETFFAYNSSAVADSTTALLRQVADCFTQGPLSDRNLILVGHTDPRGDDEYNYALGGQRASSVQSRLEGLGFPSARLDSSSRGETDAIGVDESSWRQDRRVDFRLGG